MIGTVMEGVASSGDGSEALEATGGKTDAKKGSLGLWAET